MQKILYTDQISTHKDIVDPKITEYIQRDQIVTFESFEDFDLLAFDWYDTGSPETALSRILIYLDRKDMLILCRDKRVYEKARTLLPEGLSNERALYHFFVNLLKDDVGILEAFESRITDTEDDALQSSRRDYLDQIIEFRKELLRLKRYYEHLNDILDNLTACDNGLISEDGLRDFRILVNRTGRFCASVNNLRDYVTQMREAYQAQIDIEQNSLMKVFTVITAVFLPLTLLVGWYGMNFKYMPELSWRYGYPAVIAVSVIVCVALIVCFKRKKWF